MNKRLLFAIVALLAATSVFAGTLKVVSSFASQKTWRKGLEYAGGYLYTTSNYSDNTIHVYTTTGSLAGAIPTPANSMGVEVTHAPKGYIWVNTYSPSPFRGYRMVLSTGSVVASFPGPASGYGITSDGTYLYWSTITSDRMYVLTTTGSVVRYFTQPGSFPGGCDYMAPGYLWTCTFSTSNGIYLVTTAGSLVDSFDPGTFGCTSTSGVTWDGNYLWCHNYSGSGYVYRCKVSYTGVEPASVGKVKALFR